jgi:DNA primase catalytic core
LGHYLTTRAERIRDLRAAVRQAVEHTNAVPTWQSSVAGTPPASLIADIEVWRAAHGIPATDARPTGDRQHSDTAARWQRQLNKRLQTTQSAALDEWGHVLQSIAPTLLADGFAPTLARRLSQLSSAGIPARSLLDHAAGEGPLPDDHAAAALWWRISRHITPAVAQDLDSHHLDTRWLGTFIRTVGVGTATEVQASSWWPALVATIERGLQRGWALGTLLTDVQNVSTDGHLDRTQAWVWRLSILTNPIPPTDENGPADFDEPPADLWDGYTPSDPSLALANPTDLGPVEMPEEANDEFDSIELTAEAALAIEAQIRNGLGIPEPTEADIRRMLDRADMVRNSPVTPERIAELNEMAASYYERCYPDSWAQPYLIQRFRTDLTGHPWIRPGYAPNGWTGLVDHLRRRGATDTELVTAGLATTASTGRLIDRFRDRVVFPITHQGQILGFVGRRNPTFSDDDQKGPKYLNTSETPLYHKGAQLYAAADPAGNATPVLVEGPMDAIAVTIASKGSQLGLAPLGTSLSDEQAAQFHTLGRTPVIATDPDHAGRAAAERDYWLLTPYGVDPVFAQLPDGMDPADLVAVGAQDHLTEAIGGAQSLAMSLVDAILERGRDATTTLCALRVVAAQPSRRWVAGVGEIAERSGVPAALLQSTLVPLVRAWSTDPRQAAQMAASRVAGVQATVKTQDADALAPPQLKREHRHGAHRVMPTASLPL